MNIYEFTNYVNQDVDDTFDTEEIARWFNKAMANFNLIPPVTRYPFITMDISTTTENEFIIDPDNVDSSFNNSGVFNLDEGDDEIGAYAPYPLSKTFMLGVMLPYVISAVKGQEASITEKQLAMQEFVGNARQFKSTANIPANFLLNQKNQDIGEYEIGENVFVSDMRYSPFSNVWGKSISYYEIKDEEEE